jgi:hypothetical protein
MSDNKMVIKSGVSSQCHVSKTIYRRQMLVVIIKIIIILRLATVTRLMFKYTIKSHKWLKLHTCIPFARIFP